MIEVKLPDGSTISVDTTDPKAAARAARVYIQNAKDPVYNPAEIDPGSENTGLMRNLEAGVRSFASTGTRGGSNEIAAGLGTIPDVFTNPGEIKDRYNARLDAQDTRDAADWRDVPTAKAVGTAAGFVATLPAQAATRTLGALQGGAEGAVSGFAGTDGNLVERLKGGLFGGALGAGLGAIGTPSTANLARRARVERLTKAGVKLSPGELVGGGAKRVEGALTSVSDSVFGGALRKSLDSANRAAVNRVMSPIGEVLPKSVATGTDALIYSDDTARAGYQKLLPGLVVKADDTFRTSVDDLTDAVRAEMGDEWANKLSSAYGYHIGRKINPQTGKMTGESMKEADSFLGAEIRNFSSSAVATEKKYATALRELQSNLRAATRRSNPTVAAKLRNYDRVFAGNVRLQEAAKDTADGIFTPAKLGQAVARKTSGNKARTLARGEALLQDLSGDMRSVMATAVPNSGTVDRALVVGGLGGAGALAYGALSGGGQTRGGPGADKLGALKDYAKTAATLGIPILALYSPAGRAMVAKAVQDGLLPRAAGSAALRGLPVISGLLGE